MPLSCVSKTRYGSVRSGNPNVPSGTALGERIAKFDQRLPLMGNSLIEVWLKWLAFALSFVLTIGASAVTSTVAEVPATQSGASIVVN